MKSSEHFTCLWTLAQPKVSNYICAAVPDFQQAEDILQNVAVACLRKFSLYDERRSFLGWALGVAKREILNSQRKHARSFLCFRSDLLEQLAEVCEEMGPELDLRTRALRECLKQLDGRAAKALQLRYEETLRMEEVASNLGITPLNARVLLSRIRTILRDCVERKVKYDAATI
jgi:RNA polymerase sigma-70 factor (ECF subfamily)